MYLALFSTLGVLVVALLVVVQVLHVRARRRGLTDSQLRTDRGQRPESVETSSLHRNESIGPGNGSGFTGLGW